MRTRIGYRPAGRGRSTTRASGPSGSCACRRTCATRRRSGPEGRARGRGPGCAGRACAGGPRSGRGRRRRRRVREARIVLEAGTRTETPRAGAERAAGAIEHEAVRAARAGGDLEREAAAAVGDGGARRAAGGTALADGRRRDDRLTRERLSGREREPAAQRRAAAERDPDAAGADLAEAPADLRARSRRARRVALGDVAARCRERSRACRASTRFRGRAARAGSRSKVVERSIRLRGLRRTSSDARCTPEAGSLTPRTIVVPRARFEHARRRRAVDLELLDAVGIAGGLGDVMRSVWVPSGMPPGR